jgi:hypothetical protein
MKSKPVTVRSPAAQALASRLFRKRVKPSGKQYSRKGRKAGTQ